MKEVSIMYVNKTLHTVEEKPSCCRWGCSYQVKETCGTVEAERSREFFPVLREKVMSGRKRR